MTSKTKKLVILICAVFLGGMASGLLFQLFIFPSILANSYFSQFQFIKNFKEGKIVINNTEQYLIDKETGLEKAIDKVSKTIVLIQSTAGSGSGVIVTTDGLIITLADLAPAGAKISVISEGEEFAPEIIKRDAENNLVLLKIEKTGLKTCGFCNVDTVKLGEKVFLLGINPNDLGQVANEGIVRYLNEDIIKTNITDSSYLRGSPLFNIEGNLVGLNTIDSNGKIAAIPISKIKTLAGF